MSATYETTVTPAPVGCNVRVTQEIDGEDHWAYSTLVERWCFTEGCAHRLARRSIKRAQARLERLGQRHMVLTFGAEPVNKIGGVLR